MNQLITQAVELPVSRVEKAGGFTEENLIGDIIGKFLPSIIVIGGFLTVIFIIISGIQYITSAGDPKAADSAKQRLTYAIVGFIILILSFAILQIVNKIFLGSDITK